MNNFTYIPTTNLTTITSTDLANNHIAFESIDNTGKVLVDKEEYEELLADSRLLYALIEEGVEDEWPGYDRAILRL